MKPAYYFICSRKKQLQIILRNHGNTILTFLADASEIRSKKEFVTDLVTGQLYDSRFSPNLNGHSLALHLLINADGAKFTKSKFGGFWPIDAELVELPKKLQSKFENIILLALWQGESKPAWNVVL